MRSNRTSTGASSTCNSTLAPRARAWFFHQYVEMRGWHRNCDNPIERSDGFAVLQADVPTLNHALRAAMVLDGEPYPYVKWLGQAAGQTPTGREVVAFSRQCLDALSTGALHQGGPEKDHPINTLLSQIRKTLIDAARQGSIREPWLERWREHIGPARDAIRGLVWYRRSNEDSGVCLGSRPELRCRLPQEALCRARATTGTVHPHRSRRCDGPGASPARAACVRPIPQPLT